MGAPELSSSRMNNNVNNGKSNINAAGNKDVHSGRQQTTPRQSTAHHHNNDNSTHTESTDVNEGAVDMLEMEATYTSLIQQYLQVMCIDNAIFLAERMVATCRTTNAIYLLATCHYRSGKPQRALALLDQVKTVSPASKYLLAKCAFELKHYDRAEQALLQQARAEYRQMRVNAASGLRGNDELPPMDDWIVQESPCPIPNGAAGLYLLGCICRRSNRKKRAIDYFQSSLKLDPLMWVSYEALCELGVTNVDPVSVFGVQPEAFDLPSRGPLEMNTSLQSTMPLQQQSVSSPGFFSTSVAATTATGVPRHTPRESGTPMDRMTFGDSPSATPESAIPKATLFQTARKPRTSTSSALGPTGLFQTPNLTPISMQDASFAPYHTQHSIERPEQPVFAEPSHPHTVQRAQQVASRLYYPASPETPGSFQMAAPSKFLRGMNRNPLFSGASTVSNTPIRRGGRMSLENASTARKPRALFMGSENKTENTKPESDHVHYAEMNDDVVLKPSEKFVPTYHDEEEDEGMEIAESQKAVEKILRLLCTLGTGYSRLCQYRCREALKIFHAIPHVQRNTGWVLHMEGRAFFEMSDYQNAQRCLERMQRVEPYRMKGLELLSTVLWQLKRDVEIAYLAQMAVDFDRLSPEAWCIVGNCLSLQKEHETALVFFGRSLQLDPSFTYTHTLCGYEYMANEDFEKAVSCFRSAIHVDDRHYNAWYGLGAIFHRQEKYDLAEYHFQRAVTINPQSSVLRCNLGMTQFANGKAFQALDTLGEAFRLDPHNPQARFQRASIYVALNRPEEALVELHKVRDAAPREATIHFAMGKVLKKLGRSEEAMRCFLTALDLDPKDSQLIKSAMDKLEEPDLEEEVAVF